MNLNEFFEILDEDQKNAIRKTIAEKILDAIKNADVNKYKDAVDKCIIENIEWAFQNADIDLEPLGEYLSNIIVDEMKARFQRREADADR